MPEAAVEEHTMAVLEDLAGQEVAVLGRLADLQMAEMLHQTLEAVVVAVVIRLPELLDRTVETVARVS
jgi:demethoxyubiquinone hydroxylase (CLK1/Coq7/Cat5 family)